MTSYPRSWRKKRSRYLDAHPHCVRCGDDATVVDHEPPRQQLIEAGVADPDDDAWLQSLCTPCHNRKTATTDGGFGRERTGLHQR